MITLIWLNCFVMPATSCFGTGLGLSLPNGDKVDTIINSSVAINYII